MRTLCRSSHTGLASCKTAPHGCAVKGSSDAHHILEPSWRQCPRAGKSGAAKPGMGPDAPARRGRDIGARSSAGCDSSLGAGRLDLHRRGGGQVPKDMENGIRVAARSGIPLRPIEVPRNRYLAHLYDLVLTGEVELGHSEPSVIASVHTAAMPVKAWVEKMGLRNRPTIPFPLADEDLDLLRRPDCRDYPTLTTSLSMHWTVSSSADHSSSREIGTPAASTRAVHGSSRASVRGWYECHAEPEEP